MRWHACEGTFFVLVRGGKAAVLTWDELNRDWITSGFEVADWFRAPNRATAIFKARAIGWLD